MKLIAQCDSIEAEVIQSLLEGRGFKVIVERDDCARTRPSLSFVNDTKVFVSDEDYPEAKAFLDRLDSDDDE